MFIEDDVKKDAIVVAAMVYQLSTRDDMPPRLTAADMPPKPAPTSEGGAQPAAVQAGSTSTQPAAAGTGDTKTESTPITPKK